MELPLSSGSVICMFVILKYYFHFCKWATLNPAENSQSYFSRLYIFNLDDYCRFKIFSFVCRCGTETITIYKKRFDKINQIFKQILQNSVFLWIMHLWHLQKMKTFLSWYLCICHKMALMTQSNGLNDIIIIQS